MKLHNIKYNLIWKIFIIFIVFSILQRFFAFGGIVLSGIEFRTASTFIMQVFIIILLKNAGIFSKLKSESCVAKGNHDKENGISRNFKLENPIRKSRVSKNKASESESIRTKVTKDIFFQVIFHMLINISAIILINQIFSLSSDFSETYIISNEKSLLQFLCFNFSVIFLAPVIEEIVFRYLVFDELSKKHSTALSAAISAVLFSIFHGRIQIAGAFLFGFSMQLIYLKYSNIFFPILIHSINNFISEIPEIYSFFVGKYNIKASLIEKVSVISRKTDIGVLALSLIVFLISSIYFYRFIKFELADKTRI